MSCDSKVKGADASKALCDNWQVSLYSRALFQTNETRLAAIEPAVALRRTLEKYEGGSRFASVYAEAEGGYEHIDGQDNFEMFMEWAPAHLKTTEDTRKFNVKYGSATIGVKVIEPNNIFVDLKPLKLGAAFVDKSSASFLIGSEIMLGYAAGREWHFGVSGEVHGYGILEGASEDYMIVSPSVGLVLAKVF